MERMYGYFVLALLAILLLLLPLRLVVIARRARRHRAALSKAERRKNRHETIRDGVLAIACALVVGFLVTAPFWPNADRVEKCVSAKTLVIEGALGKTLRQANETICRGDMIGQATTAGTVSFVVAVPIAYVIEEKLRRKRGRENGTF